MTAAELKDIFRSIDLKSLSDEELSSLHDLLLTKESEVRCAINQRKHIKIHFPSTDKKTK